MLFRRCRSADAGLAGGDYAVPYGLDQETLASRTLAGTAGLSAKPWFVAGLGVLVRAKRRTSTGLTRKGARYRGSLDLAGVWRLLTGARLMVCPDTGVAHLGKVVGVPSVALARARPRSTDAGLIGGCALCCRCG